MPIDAQLDVAHTDLFRDQPLVPETQFLGLHRIFVHGRGWHVSFRVVIGAGHAAANSPPVPAPGHQAWEIGLIQQRVSYDLRAQWAATDGTRQNVRVRDSRRRPDTERGATDIWAPPWVPASGGTAPVFQPFTYDDRQYDFTVQMTDGPSDPWLYFRQGVEVGGAELRRVQQRYGFRIYLVAREAGTTDVHVIKATTPFIYAYDMVIDANPYGGGGHPAITAPNEMAFNSVDRAPPPVLTGDNVHAFDDPRLIAAGLLLT